LVKILLQKVHKFFRIQRKKIRPKIPSLKPQKNENSSLSYGVNDHVYSTSKSI